MGVPLTAHLADGPMHGYTGWPRIITEYAMQSSRAFVAVLSLVGAALAASPARADAIDGDWCSGASHLLIEGSKITTPGRNVIEGEYNRYRFKYVVPANEPGAGAEINMVMIRGQEIVHLTRTGRSGEPEVWRRCKPIS